mmetsp:Transcript_7287/g.26445  ORF Transcript_7287/g.26445 Transcript_7287/m.26445 type:complete len:243 (+) Transcript_7287:541-1269(+)
MKGNAVGEELAVLQHGQWFEEDLAYLVPYSPWMWAWPKGTPKDAPGYGLLYRAKSVWEVAFGLSAYHLGFSIVFDECPGGPNLPPPFGVPGHMCTKGSGVDDLTYARLQFHFMGNLSFAGQVDMYTIEEMSKKGDEPGSTWYRGIYGGPPCFESTFGQCKPFSIGSYELTKILDEDGKPLEPYYTEFLEYMGDVPLFVWAGYGNKTVLDMLQRGDSLEAAKYMKQKAEAEAAANGMVKMPYF